jgi:hypothetical protein
MIIASHDVPISIAHNIFKQFLPHSSIIGMTEYNILSS